MKYVWALFVSVLLLSGCDDGDIIVENFNFGSQSVQKCSDSNTLYKTNDKEALIFVTPEEKFSNETQTQTYVVDTETSITYRKYSEDVITSSICGTPTQTITEEWSCLAGGTVEIKSTPIYDTNDPTKIIAYNHAITFKNVVFQAPDKQVVFENYVFGNYRTDVIDLAFDFNPTGTVKSCTTKNLIFKYNSTKALLLDVDKTQLFVNTVTAPGSPRTALINGTNFKVVYRVYSGNLNDDFFCSSITPSNPTLTEEWTANEGENNVSGIIRVVTEDVGGNTFKHTISLYKTTFKKGVKYYSPNPDGDYVFGVYYTTS
ncbi:hypothetical protein NAT51_03305 [Flavobacterium amniphilum]|uniref:hypothetical protein n=1 Tax=Flavobacterium amniphilum TaxID=1834035 RepID=UPI00202A1233|nr:hypothetical protein [Flavobacterium amniphilum]MCL9804533.1 hypothetical protein [Flavobacterium amniphilum]